MLYLSMPGSIPWLHSIIIKYKLVMMMSQDMIDSKGLIQGMVHEGTPDVKLSASEVEYYTSRANAAVSIALNVDGLRYPAEALAGAIFDKIAVNIYYLRRDGNGTSPSSVSEPTPVSEAAPESEAAAEPTVGSEAAAEPAVGSEAAWTGDPRRLVEKLGVKEAHKFLLDHGWMSSQNPHVVWTYVNSSTGNKLFLNLRTQSEWTLE